MDVDNDYVTLSMDPLLKQNGMVYNVSLTASNPYLYYGTKTYMFKIMIQKINCTLSTQIIPN